MGVELVYHRFDAESAETPFEDVLARLSDVTTLDLACPYLSLDVLTILAERAESWRLITDVQEWIRSRPKDYRGEVLEFIEANNNSIHDCRNLHAKVIRGGDAAMVGSANFTHTGLTMNSEMAVLFEHTDQVDELSTWFDDLWTRTHSPDLKELEAYLADSESSGSRDTGTTMPDTGPAINTSLRIFSKPTITVDKKEHEQLVHTVKQTPDREWIESYFDWVAELIEYTGLEESDERIATTIPRSSSRLPVIVNRRYMLAAFPKQRRIGIILPPDSLAIDKLSEFISDFGTFSTNSDQDPYWFEFPGDPHEFITNDIKHDWRAAIRQACSRGSRSEYRHHHRAAAYKAAVDEQYRQTVLNSAFSNQE